MGFLSGLRIAECELARRSIALREGGRRMGEQETELMAMLRRRSFRGRMERGGGFAIIFGFVGFVSVSVSVSVCVDAE